MDWIRWYGFSKVFDHKLEGYLRDSFVCDAEYRDPVGVIARWYPDGVLILGAWDFRFRWLYRSWICLWLCDCSGLRETHWVCVHDLGSYMIEQSSGYGSDVFPDWWCYITDEQHDHRLLSLVLSYPNGYLSPVSVLWSIQLSSVNQLIS